MRELDKAIYVSSYPNQAKAYIEALKLGATALEEVVEWADTIILQEEEPNVYFIELSLSKNISEAITHLGCLTFGSSEEQAMKILFGILYEGLKSKRCSYQDVSKRLFFWSAYETSLSGYGELISYWDALDLAEAGHFGDPDVVKSEMLEFFKKHKSE